MKTLTQVAGAYLVLMATAAGVNWVATGLFDNSSGIYPVWRFLNWFLLVAVATMMTANLHRMIEFHGEGSGAVGTITRRYLEVNLAFFASVLFTLWFYWNAFYTLFPQNEPEVVFLIHLEWWAFINPLQVLVMGATGTYLWRRARDIG